MRELAERELYQALHYAKSLDENAGRTIIEKFQIEQPAFAQTIFGVFSSEIAKQDESMAYLFMDLCFDVLCVFQHAFGALPDQQSVGYEWLERSAALLDPELQAMMPDNRMDATIRNKLQDRFTERLIESNAQTGLINFMNESIDEFVLENPSPIVAVRMTKTMMFVVVQLFCSMYDYANVESNR